MSEMPIFERANDYKRRKIFKIDQAVDGAA